MNGAALAVGLILWLWGLQAVGPVRASLLEYGDLALICVLDLAVRGGSSGRSGSAAAATAPKTRGTVLMALGYVVLLWANSPTAVLPVEYNGGAAAIAPPPQLAVDSAAVATPPSLDTAFGAARRRLLSVDAAPSAEDLAAAGVDAGVLPGVGGASEGGAGAAPAAFTPSLESPIMGSLLLAVASLLDVGRCRATRKLSAQVGGARRLQAMSLAAAAALTAPAALVSWLSGTAPFFGARVLPAGAAPSAGAFLGAALAYAFFSLVCTFYFDIVVVSQRLDESASIRIGLVSAFVWSFMMFLVRAPSAAVAAAGLTASSAAASGVPVALFLAGFALVFAGAWFLTAGARGSALGVFGFGGGGGGGESWSGGGGGRDGFDADVMADGGASALTSAGGLADGASWGRVLPHLRKMMRHVLDNGDRCVSCVCACVCASRLWVPCFGFGGMFGGRRDVTNRFPRTHRQHTPPPAARYSFSSPSTWRSCSLSSSWGCGQTRWA